MNTDDEKRPAGVCYCGTGPIDGEICDECSSGDSDIYRFVRMLVARDARIEKLEAALRPGSSPATRLIHTDEPCAACEEIKKQNESEKILDEECFADASPIPMPSPIGRLVNQEKVEEARFDERVACAAIVLQQSSTSGQPQRDWAQEIAKAILARGKA